MADGLQGRIAMAIEAVDAARRNSGPLLGSRLATDERCEEIEYEAQRERQDRRAAPPNFTIRREVSHDGQLTGKIVKINSRASDIGPHGSSGTASGRVLTGIRSKTFAKTLQDNKKVL